jgi:hypothetical protein
MIAPRLPLPRPAKRRPLTNDRALLLLGEIGAFAALFIAIPRPPPLRRARNHP